MKLSFVKYTLLFKRPFSIAHGVRNSTPVVFTQIEYDGILGYGEASMPPYLGENHNTVIAFLSEAEKILKNFSPFDETDAVLNAIDNIKYGNTAAKASVDIALHDLIGKLKNKPIHKIFDADIRKQLFTAYTIPIDDVARIKERIQEANEYKLLKIKLGSGNDKELVEEILKYSTKSFFVDVNEGWKDRYFALDMLHWLAEKKCLFAEQPMPREMTDDIALLAEKSPIPVIADESVKRWSDLEKIKNVYNGINIKLMKCTGLNEARKMITRAREYGMKIMLGCMSETSCGVSAAAQIAPFADWVDLDGPLLIKNDCFDGVKFSRGRVLLNDLPGIGINPKEIQF